MTDTQITQTDRLAAWEHRPSCYKVDDYTNWMAGRYDFVAAIIKAFAAHRTNRTDATPVAWIDLLSNAYTSGAEDVHNAWIEGTASSEPDFGEAASDYARSIDFPPATDVAALVDAAKAFQHYGCPVCSGDCGSANPPVMACPMQALSAALAPFTKGQNDA